MNGNNLSKTALHYGAMSGLSCFLVFILLYFSNLSPLGPGSWLGAWIPIVFMVLSTKFHRDHNLGGGMTFGQGFTVSFLTAFCGALLFALLVYLFGSLIDGRLLTDYKEEAMQGMEQAKSFLSDEMIDKAMEGVEQITMGSIAFNDFFGKMLGGTIISLIIGAVMRKDAAVNNY